LDANLYVAIEHTPDPATHNLVVALEKEPFPLSFNVEFGAYLTTIRSSLDILAVAVARRYPTKITRVDDVYFPTAASESEFRTGKQKWRKFIDALPQTERAKFESLKPYPGGDGEALRLLHQLDIERKHHRLLSVFLLTTGFSVPDGTRTRGFEPAFESWQSADNKTILGRLLKGIEWPCDEIKLRPVVAVNEPKFIQYKPVVETLKDFANFAALVIRLFAI
jgi:hypothetical protein